MFLRDRKCLKHNLDNEGRGSGRLDILLRCLGYER